MNIPESKLAIENERYSPVQNHFQSANITMQGDTDIYACHWGEQHSPVSGSVSSDRAQTFQNTCLPSRHDLSSISFWDMYSIRRYYHEEELKDCCLPLRYASSLAPKPFWIRSHRLAWLPQTLIYAYHKIQRQPRLEICFQSVSNISHGWLTIYACRWNKKSFSHWDVCSICKYHPTSTSKKPKLSLRCRETLVCISKMLAVEKWLLSRWEVLVPSVDTTDHVHFSRLKLAIEEGRQSRNEILVQSAIAKFCACRREIKTVSPGNLSSACYTIGRGILETGTAVEKAVLRHIVWTS